MRLGVSLSLKDLISELFAAILPSGALLDDDLRALLDDDGTVLVDD